MRLGPMSALGRAILSHLSVQFCTDSERHLSQDGGILSKDSPPYASLSNA